MAKCNQLTSLPFKGLRIGLHRSCCSRSNGPRWNGQPDFCDAKDGLHMSICAFWQTTHTPRAYFVLCEQTHENIKLSLVSRHVIRQSGFKVLTIGIL